ncbi:hypothetical protein TRAPUB_3164 [Trametes pubescens]|uniref:Uncharacterized protein n=1 Tax=Trametes pubescens TaxID=154538 RepID=A0A1M2VEL2_TRAPU|nr:hypothetical protein TRAPUB_3164 [Trametes pubescens]
MEEPAEYVIPPRKSEGQRFRGGLRLAERGILEAVLSAERPKTGLAARSSPATVPGNAGRHVVDHYDLIFALKNMIDKLEAERAS